MKDEKISSVLVDLPFFLIHSVLQQTFLMTHCALFTAYKKTRASLVAQLVKNLPAMQETWVLSLGPEDPLEEG